MIGRVSIVMSPRHSISSACAVSSAEIGVKNPRPPVLIPSIGVVDPATCRATRNSVPSPPTTSSKSTLFASAAMVSHESVLTRATNAVCLSVSSVRPVRVIIAAILRASGPNSGFSALPVSPIRQNVLVCFFKQHKKFFVASRAKQR